MLKKSLLLMLLMALLVPWAAAQQALPYSYGFEDNDLSTDGWTTENPSGLDASKFMISTSAKRTGNYGFQFSSYDDQGAHTQYLISPELSAANGLIAQFYYRAYSSYGLETFKVGYSTTDTQIASFTFGSEISTSNSSWTQSEEFSFPAGTKYVAIYYYANWQYYLYVDDFTFVAPPSCAKPTDLAATLTPGDGTKATLNWTAGGSETAWVLEYGTASDFTGATSVNVSGTPTKNLTGLTAEATYYARVKADCGGEESDWSNTCVFTPTNAYILPIGTGTAFSGSDGQGSPMGYAYYYNSAAQFIYTAEELASMSGSTINSIAFYHNGYSFTDDLLIYLDYTTASTVDVDNPATTATLVYNHQSVIIGGDSEGWQTFDLDEPFDYNGTENLLVIVCRAKSNGYSSSQKWQYSVTNENQFMCRYADDTNYADITNTSYAYTASTKRPNIQFTYEPPASCPKPTGLTYSDLANRSVKLSWTEKGEATSWQISVNGDETNLITANTNTNFLLDNLEPETEYTVKVRAYCDPKDQSEWSTPVSFTTLVACETPTEFHAENITAFTADLKWTSTVGDYKVRYGEHTATPELLQYDNGTLATNVGYGGEICWGVMYPAGSFTGNYLSTVTNYDVDVMTGNLFIYSGGTTAPEKLIASKAITFTGVDDFVDITFDQLVPVDPSENLWIVIKQTGGANYPAAAAVDPGDANARWASLDGGSSWGDLADYGLPGYGWMIRANIETISLTGTGISWTDNTYPLTGLTQKTKYAAQVRNVCGGIDGESAWATTLFSTTASCVAPEGLAISGEVTAREASFTWTADEVTFQYCVIANPAPGYIPDGKEFDHETTGNTATINTLTPDTDYVFYLRKKCSSTDFSDIVSIAFRTDLACYAPESLTVDNIATYSATLNWTGTDGDYDVRYGLYPTSTNQETLTYGITQTSNLGGSSAGDRTWGVKYPGSQITGNFLTGIVIPYVPSYNSNDYITLNVYIGGDNAPRNLVSTEILYPETSGVNTLTLTNPVALQAGENLWITLTETGTYVVPIGASTEENTQWYFNGTEWTLWPYMVSNEYGCVIDGIMETLDIDNVEWTNATSTTGSYPMSGLTASTQYMAQVRHNCGGDDGESIWWTAQFTTDAACPIPTDLVASDITGHEATLSWTGDADGNYNIDYRIAAGMQVLFEEGFEDATEFGNWTRNNCVSGSNRSTDAKRTGSYGFKFSYNSSSSGITPPQYLISPDLSAYTANDVILSFYYTKGSSNSYTETFKVGWSSTTNDPAEFTWDSEITATALWDNYSHTIPAGTKYISIAYTANDKLRLFIDDLAIGEIIPAGEWQHATAKTNSKQLNGLLAETKYDARVQKDCDPVGTSEWSDIISFTTDVACATPTDLDADNITTTTADLIWTANSGESIWTIYYKKTSDESYTEVTNVKVNPYTLPGLTPATSYEYYVVANCSDTETSEPSAVFSFATECDNIIITDTDTYSEGFEDYPGVAYDATNGVVPVCWEPYTTGSVKPHVIASGGSYAYIHTGTKALTFYGYGYNYAAMPEFTNALSELRIKFWMRCESASSGTLTLGYITDEDDGTFNTFNVIETYAGVTTMTQRITDLNEVPATATRLVFRWYYGSQYSCCIDDVEVMLIPSCMDPSDLHATETTTTTATLEWTENGSATSWQICIDGDEENLIDADTNPFTVPGLTPSTAYTAKVRAYCSATDQSSWSAEISFTTKCEAVVVDATNPFFEGFEDTTFPPVCWENIVSGTRKWSRSTSSSSIHTGSGSAYSGYYGDIYLVMPDLAIANDDNATAVELTFWSKNTYVSYYDKNSVVLLDGTTETELWSPIEASSVWEKTTINLDAYKGQTISLAFKYEGNNAHGWYVDDVEVHFVYTFTMPITGYGTSQKGGYVLLATPVKDVDVTTTNMIASEAEDYDLYRFNQSAAAEWENYKNHSFNLESGKGYLYANKYDATLTFTGALYTGDGKIDLTYDGLAYFPGVNLIGNPYSTSAEVSKPYYRLNSDGSALKTETESTTVYAMEGVFVVATEAGETADFTVSSKAGKAIPTANIVISDGNRSFIDNAIIRFDEGSTLSKYQLSANSTKVYFPMDDNDYAIANADASGEMPLNFKAETTGKYTISFKLDGANLSYLHLIDKATGEDINLFTNPEYSFIGSPRDAEDRFIIRFSEASANDFFVYQNDDQIIVKGEGELQVYDVMGRFVGTYNVNGTEIINASQFANNVYIFRLVGETVKTQKIVVR